jgi:hypothetical protein
LIASGFSPRSAITHKHQAPEERRKRWPRFGSCLLRIVAGCYSWAPRSGSLMRHQHVRNKTSLLRSLGYCGATGPEAKASGYQDAAAPQQIAGGPNLRLAAEQRFPELRNRKTPEERRKAKAPNGVPALPFTRFVYANLQASQGNPIAARQCIPEGARFTQQNQDLLKRPRK